MNGAEYIAEFLHQRGMKRVFLLTGGACAFIVDAIARHPAVDYYCFQHEQGAAMAADAVWRASGEVGVALATSGPGATNLLTGIACSFFDSTPALFITGQVNMRESADWAGARVRQLGFQETRIAEMAAPITKYAVMVRTGEELKRELAKAYNIAITGRRGPVLIDVPMDVQQAEVGAGIEYQPPVPEKPELGGAVAQLEAALRGARRPVVLFGAGVGLSGAAEGVAAWLARTGLPFVSSWNGLSWFDHDLENFCGQIGVYGNRGANAILQNADTLLVLGSRLDNRQRSGNAKNFAPGARVHVVDIDGEELKKYRNDGYGVTELDLRWLPEVLERVEAPAVDETWQAHVAEMKARYFGRDTSRFARTRNTLSPYAVVQTLNRLMARDAVVICDTGANLCWVYQIFHRKAQTLFTAGGNSPMGYSVPAAIGAALARPDRQIIAFIGDGGFQVNIQELQTIRAYGLNIVIVVMNNGCYGMIRQFQDSYCDSRHAASVDGYAAPDFSGIVRGYGLGYHRVENLEDISPDILQERGGVVIDVMLAPDTPIEPRLEMGRPINDQQPYLSDEDHARDNPFLPRSQT